MNTVDNRNIERFAARFDYRINKHCINLGINIKEIFHVKVIF